MKSFRRLPLHDEVGFTRCVFGAGESIHDASRQVKGMLERPLYLPRLQLSIATLLRAGQSAEHRRKVAVDGTLRVSPDRDHGQVRKRYLRASKPELFGRIVAARDGLRRPAEPRLRTDDDLLV